MTNAATTATFEAAATVDTYLEMWNETDVTRRAGLIAEAWAPEGKYCDPLLQASGHEELSAIAAVTQQQFPNHCFVRTTGIDAHHEFVRFGWQLVGPDGALVVTGVDVGIVNAAGKLTRIVGFFGEPPAK